VLSWRGRLKPTWLCETYEVNLQYRLGSIAVVRVVSPEITKDLERALPHVYAGNALCLHLKDDWGPHLHLVNTIIPWTVEWLFFYEIWRYTDKWCGTGDWPPRRQSEDSAA
jgi:hypothetical protein